jgi:hypothetical protein
LQIIALCLGTRLQHGDDFRVFLLQSRELSIALAKRVSYLGKRGFTGRQRFSQRPRIALVAPGFKQCILAARTRVFI